MMYPLVRELAADGIPVAVTCRVLGFSKQAYFKWLASPVSQRDWDDAHLINAAVEIHHDDPAFGYRFIADELEGRGVIASENRTQRLCSQQQIWSVFAKKRGLSRKAGPPVHDDLVNRKFTASAPNVTWLTDITEHWTAEGKLYLCAIKDLFSNRIVGYSIDARMTADLACAALRNAIALRDPVRTTVHSDRGSQGEFNRSSQHPVVTGVFDGTTAATSGPGVATRDALSRSADPGQARGAGVLAADRAGQGHRRRSEGDRRVHAGRVAVVSPRWRHAALEPGRALRPFSVVSGA
jgi:putative transposase